MVIHEQSFDGKHGFSLTTAGSGGERRLRSRRHEPVPDGLWSYLRRRRGMLCLAGPSAMEAAVKRSHDMGKDLVAAIGEKRRYRSGKPSTKP